MNKRSITLEGAVPLSTVKFIYVVGVEGCGHHALYPVIETAVRENQRRRGIPDTPETVFGRWILLRKLFSARWYTPHADSTQIATARQHIGALVQELSRHAAETGHTHYIIEDNSFPSGQWRRVSQQWSLVEMAELLAPHVELRFIALYRNPIAMTFSHAEWDGGLRRLQRW